jgi:hypothetical protein
VSREEEEEKKATTTMTKKKEENKKNNQKNNKEKMQRCILGVCLVHLRTSPELVWVPTKSFSKASKAKQQKRLSFLSAKTRTVMMPLASRAASWSFSYCSCDLIPGHRRRNFKFKPEKTQSM